MDSILDRSPEIDVIAFDKLVNTFYQSSGEEQARAGKMLTQFQENPDSWLKVDKIIERSSNENAKFISVQILERLVSTRWKALQKEQSEGIKNFVISIIIKISSEEATMRRERMLLNKFNVLLIHILKNEWPSGWPNFIPEIVGASRSSLSICENNLNILKLLSEEIFDFSAEQMTTVRAKHLKSQFCNEFSEIFRLCLEILEKAQKPTLIQATLEALLRFLKWIPLGYIFETTLIGVLQSRFLTHNDFKNVTIACFSEISALIVGEEYDARFANVFEVVLKSLGSTLPYSANMDLALAFERCREEDAIFIKSIALYFTSALSNHMKAIEAQCDLGLVIQANLYMLKITQINDMEIFKVCLEYWYFLVANLYNEYPYSALESSPLLLGNIVQTNSRRAKYSAVLSSLRVTMIEKMVKPEEVLIVEDENGEIVREQVKEIDTIVLYKSIREILVFLTHLDCEDTEGIMIDKLSRQIDGSEWSWANINKLCWAVGSISGAMNEEIEERFLVTVIRDLLGLVEMKRGKDNKAVIAANIMYVVGQYPRFLKAHWKFLKTVVNKLFEFMHELHEGVQDMACDTFLKIATKCKRHFVIHQPGEAAPFIEEILTRLPAIIGDLQAQQVHVFYESMGHVIHAQNDSATASAYLASLMQLPNQSWDSIIASISKNPSMIENVDTLRSVSSILKTSIYTCKSLGTPFISQLTRIYLDMLSLYRTVSGQISSAISQRGLVATKTPVIRAMRACKRDALRLVETYVHKLDHPSVFTDEYISYLFESILIDYRQNVAEAREAEVLNVTTAIISTFGGRAHGYIRPVVDAIFECTLSMINRDFSDYPDHRVAFFKLLRSFSDTSFKGTAVAFIALALIELPEPIFKLYMDSVSWAFKHNHREVSSLGLEICSNVLSKISECGQQIRDQFYSKYLFSILQDIFYVLTDVDHKSGFNEQCIILSQLFYAICSDAIQVPLSKSVNSAPENAGFVQKFIQNLLLTGFPHLQMGQVEVFIRGLYDLNSNAEIFNAHVHDFLIALREISNDSELSAEMALEKERKRKLEEVSIKRIPGMVKPSEIAEESD